MKNQADGQARPGENRDNSDSASLSSGDAQKELQFRLCRFLLSKYSELINESERRTIGEIKGLVNSDDLTIQSILADLKPQNFGFEKDFLQTAEKIFNFVASEINFAELDTSLNYWLSPKEIFSEKIADDEDIAIFLCSLLLGIGDEKAFVVLAELENLQTHAFVITEFRENFFILDASQGHVFSKFSGNRDKVLMDFSFKGAKIKQFLYKFNHSTYEQFVDTE
ncbi:MAG: transglutaminase-like domain-containing protein [Candidatus ainarchaeum sp.]|nr:transglutaminase-like domain-containing protein [Candidatus ainarchaeum sp.]